MRRWPWARRPWPRSASAQPARSRYPTRASPAPRRAVRPSFLIIGIGKWHVLLYYYLAAHPFVIQARRKQVQFFDHAYDASRISSRYLSQFPSSLKEGEVTGEASLA